MPSMFTLSSFESLQWAFPVAVTFHHIEEAIWLAPRAGEPGKGLPVRFSVSSFRAGLVALTIAAYGITWLSLERGRGSASTYVFVAYVFVMFLNVWIPHVSGAILLRTYAPGVVTAVFLILPITSLLLMRVGRDGIVRTRLGEVLVFGFPLLLAEAAAIWFASRGKPHTSRR